MPDISLHGTERLAAAHHAAPAISGSDGGIWFSLGNLFQDAIGVARFKDERFTIYASDAGLPVTVYLDIIADQEGSIWIASTSGLFRLKRKPITAYSTAEGLSHNEVYPLLQTRDGRITVGTTHGISLIADGAVVRDPLNDFKDVVQSLWEDRQGRLWIGTTASLYRYGNGKIEDLTPPPIKGTSVVAIHEDRTGAIWVGTSGASSNSTVTSRRSLLDQKRLAQRRGDSHSRGPARRAQRLVVRNLWRVGPAPKGRFT